MLLHRFLMLCILLLGLPASADTLWLDNGDRLSGQIEFMTGNTLLIRTDYAGEVAVEFSRISTLESDNPLLIKAHDDFQRTRLVQASEEPGQALLLNEQGEPVPFKLSDLRQLMSPRPVIDDWRWRGNADLMLELENTDSKKRELDMDVSIEARHASWRHVLAGEYERDYRNDVVRRHRWELDYAFSWFMTEQWFWENRIRHRRDHLDEISRELELGSGLGYQWWSDALGRFETVARLVHLRMDMREGADSHTNGLGFGMGYRRYLFGKRFEVVQKAKAVLPDDPAVSYIAEAKLGLRYLLNDWASLNLGAEWEYIDSSDEKALNETVYTLGFGVNW